ncbi:MAG: class I SAM-dependent methyltransferase [Deltaproteobacteria bacterium]|jgi:SAM-dependent methyltransferase|nr:class I SAM-dependent methyltransferase [Deltaproteobacteria bacterium]
MLAEALSGFFKNARKPAGKVGTVFLRLMNVCHAPLSRWGLSFIDVRPDDDVLDLGCGGGANIARLLKSAARGAVRGLDYSERSVAVARKVNRRAIETGRCEIVRGEVQSIPWPDASFQIACAFETVYFWGDREAAFREVARVLAPGGRFFICNSLDELSGGDKNFWRETIGLDDFSTAEIVKNLEAAGFEKTSVKEKGRMRLVSAARPAA